MHHSSVSWHIIPVKFSGWNIICFGQKEPIKVQFFRLLSALIKVHPIPHAIFETTRSGFIQILHHCSVSWKITPLYFCSSNLVYFGQKEPTKRNFQTFEWLSENSPNSSCNIWNHKSVFLLTLHHSSVSWDLTLLYFFSWNFIWFGQKESIKVQNFRLLTAYVKFHQACTLICSFCWRYIKFQLKKYGGFMSHETEDWCKIWRKTDLWFRKRHDEFSKFLLEHLKLSKLGIWWDLYIQGRKCMSLKFTEELCFMTLKNDAKCEEKLSCRSKIDMRNLTNFYKSTRKSKKFAL